MSGFHFVFDTRVCNPFFALKIFVYFSLAGYQLLGQYVLDLKLWVIKLFAFLVKVVPVAVEI
jgi:hypothetical protein